jgi:hypothetical protein
LQDFFSSRVTLSLNEKKNPAWSGAQLDDPSFAREYPQKITGFEDIPATAFFLLMFENTEQDFCFNFYGISGTLAKTVKAE